MKAAFAAPTAASTDRCRALLAPPESASIETAPPEAKPTVHMNLSEESVRSDQSLSIRVQHYLNS